MQTPASFTYPLLAPADPSYPLQTHTIQNQSLMYIQKQNLARYSPFDMIELGLLHQSLRKIIFVDYWQWKLTHKTESHKPSPQTHPMIWLSQHFELGFLKI